MRGYIKKRYKTSWSICVNMGRDPATGKRKQHWENVKGTRKDAEQRLAELLHQIDTGTFAQPSHLTVGDFLNQWLDNIKGNLAPNTIETYQFFVRKHIAPAIGQTPLTALRPEHLQKLYTDKLESGLGARSVRYIHVTLHKALKTAVKMGMLTRNPADAVDPPQVKRPELHTMDEDDIQKFLETAKPTPYYALFYFAIFTGMRRGELLALRWQDIDVLLCEASVTRSLIRLHDGSLIFGQPKTEKGRRMVSLPPSVMGVLRDHKEKQKAEHILMGIHSSDSDLVFAQPDGKPFLPDSVSHAWKNIAQKAGCDVTLHGGRHTHATLLLKQGVHPKVVSERLGHASVVITLDTYSHVMPGLQEAAAQGFDEALKV